MSKQKNTRNFLYILLLVISAAVIGIWYFSQSIRSTGIIGNQRILDEIVRLETLNNKLQLTEGDYSQLLSMVKGDPTAEDLTNDSLWFVQHNIPQHASHALGDLYRYINTGNYSVCIPHEIEHIGGYLKFNETDKVQEGLSRINDYYLEWKTQAYQLQAKYPATYKNLTQLIQNIDSVLTKLNSNNMNVYSEIDFITQNELCGTV